MQLRAVLVAEFQKRMQRSAVPPPDASRPCWWGDHAIACSVLFTNITYTEQVDCVLAGGLHTSRWAVYKGMHRVHQAQ